MENCIFCKIIAKRIPAKEIYEDDDLIAFHDINPAASIHFLIVPRQHIPTLADCTEADVALLGKITLLAARLAQKQGCSYQKDREGAEAARGGYKTIFNIGPDGGQEVYHLHLHVIGGPKPWRGQR